MTGSVQSRLDLGADAAELTRALIDIPSVSESEQQIADAVEAAVGALPRLRSERVRNVVVARYEAIYRQIAVEVSAGPAAQGDAQFSG